MCREQGELNDLETELHKKMICNLVFICGKKKNTVNYYDWIVWTIIYLRTWCILGKILLILPNNLEEKWGTNECMLNM